MITNLACNRIQANIPFINLSDSLSTHGAIITVDWFTFECTNTYTWRRPTSLNHWTL